MSRACFAAGTPLLTPEGSKPIEQFRPGDLLLSAPENDPTGAVEPREVEEVFTRHWRLFALRVAGREIRTTAEHPFYVEGKGWTPASLLASGDLLRSHDGRWLPLESVDDTGQDAVVYNMRIAEYHTYFVGSAEWGFSVWSHNSTGGYGAGGSSTKAPSATQLTRAESDALREAARNVWETRMGWRAIWNHLDVHHRIPLEWAHLFRYANPNRVANLVGIATKNHPAINALWTAFRTGLQGRMPSAAEVMKKAIEIDKKLGHLFTFLP